MKILVIGEKCEDNFIYGSVKRLSPEAPVPVFVPQYTETNDGMSGNVVANLRTFVRYDKVELICQYNKITKTRYVDDKSNHMFIRVDVGDDRVDPFKIHGHYISAIKNADVVIISDYNKGFLTNEDIIEIAKLSKLVIIDTKKKLTKEIIESVNFIKLNEIEYNNNKDILSHYPEKVIITLGMNGARYGNDVYPSQSPILTMDVSGAGDTFTASFSYYYLISEDIPSSITFANDMASRVVAKRGVSIP